jgi:hypothetical protein
VIFEKLNSKIALFITNMAIFVTNIGICHKLASPRWGTPALENGFLPWSITLSKVF